MKVSLLFEGVPFSKFELKPALIDNTIIGLFRLHTKARLITNKSLMANGTPLFMLGFRPIYSYKIGQLLILVRHVENTRLECILVPTTGPYPRF